VLWINTDTGALKELHSQYLSRKLLCLSSSPSGDLLVASGDVATGDAARRSYKRQPAPPFSQGDWLSPGHSGRPGPENESDEQPGFASGDLPVDGAAGRGGVGSSRRVLAGAGSGLSDHLTHVLQIAPSRRSGGHRGPRTVPRAPVEVWRMADLQERMPADGQEGLEGKGAVHRHAC
jgi:hypothetical protein